MSAPPMGNAVYYDLFFFRRNRIFLFEFKFQSRLSSQKFQIDPGRVYRSRDFAYIKQWHS